MKIGYDAKRLFTNFTGLGNYSRALVSNYHENFPEDEIFLFTPSLKQDPRTEAFIADQQMQIRQPVKNKLLWRTLDIVNDIKAAGCDIYHGLSHELPVGISKLDMGKVVTIHDLIFKYYPNDNSWFDRKIYDWKWKHACQVADVIISISEATKRDIIKYYSIDPGKIKVIYQPADVIFSRTVSDQNIDAVKKKYNLPESYLLYTGSIISRKNLLSVIKAIALLKPSERIPLVIIGNGARYKNEVQNEAALHKIDHLLIWLGSPQFSDFPAIYKSAVMMIYPSLHEGFGLPVIEAMQTGIPVITSNQSSLKEAGGDAAILVDPLHPDEITTAILNVMSDDKLRSKLIEKGHHHVEKFDPKHSISELRKIYTSLR